ncbi:DNA-binding protein [Agarilytica rhodophyticola]|uniref:DNA-binding protein n=1 Tax=Agarilytica rhodophyticola TaxID=1737490 RepID=UPI000CD9981F|nr:DNA-binding protein [Agarilytica rhodophyticola]
MSKITFEDVCIAARRLVESGERPSAPKIRKLLGDRGGMATIQKHLDGWRVTEEGKEADTPKIPEMPESLANDSHTLIQQIWGQAKASADLDIQNEREKLALDRAEMDEKLAETIAVSEEQEAQIDELRGNVEDLQHKTSNLVESNDKHKAQLSEEITKNSILTERCDQLEKSLSAAETGVSQLEGSLSSERTKREALAEEASKFRALADERQSLIANLQAQVNKLESSLTSRDEQITKLQDLTEAQQQKLDEAKEAFAEAKSDLSTLIERCDQLQKTVNEAAAREKELQALHASSLQAADERTAKLIEQLEKFTGVKDGNSKQSKD